MSTQFRMIAFPVKDLAAAKKLYGTLLGVEPYVDSPYYVGYRVGGIEIGLDPNGHAKGMTAPQAYWGTDDINADLQTLVSAGGSVQKEISDVGGGALTALVNDADGNTIGLVGG